MNSFRVVDTRFRILKGGKIGLSLSISLMAGIMILGSVNANAIPPEYFIDVTTTLGTDSNNQGAFDVTVQTATNNGALSIIRTESSADSVVFKPISFATSTYGTPSFEGDVDSNGDLVADSSKYNLNKINSPFVLNLTFDSGAKASDISKSAATPTVYTAPISNIVNISSNSTYNLDSTGPSSYKANLIFKGANAVSGNTDIGDGNIKLDGGATFTGTVTAGSIDVDTTSTVTFNGAVDLTLDPTKDLKFNTNGDIVLNSDLKGDVTLTADNQGTITTTGATQTITGNIGTSVSNDLGTLNIGSITNPTNHSTTTIDGNVFANSTVLNNNGITTTSKIKTKYTIY